METSIYICISTTISIISIMISTIVGVSIVMGVPHNGGFMREIPIKMDDLGAPHMTQETPR